MERSRNQVIELLRFIAAAAVVALHLPALNFSGSWGVDMFFIISGFVMMLSTTTDHDKFFTKRLIRIVPIYWVMTIAIFFLAIFMPGVLSYTSADFSHLVKSMFFVPFDKNGAGHFPILFVGWTLNYEMFFYAIFAVALFISSKHKDLITAAVLFGFVICFKPLSGFFPQVYGNLIILEFVLGLALFELLGQRRLERLALYTAIYLAPLLLFEGVMNDRAYRFGLPCFVGALLAMRILNNVKFPKPILTLGGASYALYLSHIYVIQFCDKVLDLFRFGPAINLLVSIFVFAVTLVAAVLLYKCFERPVTKWLRARWL